METRNKDLIASADFGGRVWGRSAQLFVPGPERARLAEERREESLHSTRTNLVALRVRQ